MIFQHSSDTICSRHPMIKKPLLKMEKQPSRRLEEEGVELRAYPDPANNIDEDDVDIKRFDDPLMMNKWVTRAHGNNKMSAAKFK